MRQAQTVSSTPCESLVVPVIGPAGPDVLRHRFKPGADWSSALPRAPCRINPEGHGLIARSLLIPGRWRPGSPPGLGSRPAIWTMPSVVVESFGRPHLSGPSPERFLELALILWPLHLVPAASVGQCKTSTLGPPQVDAWLGFGFKNAGAEPPSLQAFKPSSLRAFEPCLPVSFCVVKRFG